MASLLPPLPLLYKRTFASTARMPKWSSLLSALFRWQMMMTTVASLVDFLPSLHGVKFKESLCQNSYQFQSLLTRILSVQGHRQHQDPAIIQKVYGEAVARCRGIVVASDSCNSTNLKIIFVYWNSSSVNV